jgi:hypothetical protein
VGRLWDNAIALFDEIVIFKLMKLGPATAGKYLSGWH